MVSYTDLSEHFTCVILFNKKINQELTWLQLKLKSIFKLADHNRILTEEPESKDHRPKAPEHDMNF